MSALPRTLALALCISAGARAEGTERLVLLEPQLNGAPASWASEAIAGFSRALQESGRFSVLSARDAADIVGVERQKQLMGSGGQGVFALAAAVKARFVVTSTIRRAAGRVELSAVLEDLREQQRFEDARESRASSLGTDAATLLRGLIGRLPPDKPARDLPMPPPPKLTNASPKPLRVAVLDPRPAGDVPPRALEAFRQSLAPELRKIEGLSCISSSEIRDMLSMERQRQLMGCGEDSSCLAELAGAMDVEDLVTIDLALVGDKYSLNARRLSLSRAKVVQSASQKFDKRDGEELLAVVGPTVASLYPDRKLRPGRTRGIDEAVIRRLNPPPLPRWAFAVTAGATAVAGATAAVFALQTLQDQHDFNNLVQAAGGQPQSGAEAVSTQHRLDASAKLTNVTLGVTGGLAAAAIIEVFFTDWYNDRAAFSAQPIALSGGGGLVFGAAF